MACLVRANGGVWSYPLQVGAVLRGALQSAVGGSFKTVCVADGRRVVMNARGVELGLPENERLLDMVGRGLPEGERLVGDCVLCAPGELESVLFDREGEEE